MDFSEILNMAIDLFQTHTLISIGIIVVLGGLTIWRPKAMLRVGVLIVAMAAILYILSLMGNMTSTGVSSKKEMIHKNP